MSAPHSMFGGNNLITSCTFNQTVARTELSICFDKLASKASPMAFHLADSDLSRSTCFTSTRTKILERMKSWALYNSEKDKFVMWLHGPAGGGKTAIGRTIAKWCEQEGILLGEFFFSRADGTGDQLASLAPTLAYRMAVHTLQDAKEAIANVVSHDPHIFLAPLAVQLKKLVLDPLNLFVPCGIVPYVIILDGLDETLSPDDQQLVLNAISETLCHPNSRLRILVCCRPEPTIVTAFNDADSLLNAISTNISLNNDVDSDADIRKFLVEKFARTKKQLPHPPSEDWPTPENIDYLVAKSSGQFIFAATVEKYVCSPRHRHQAVARLKHVLDLSLLPHFEDKKKHPFADLDALYSLILRTRNDVNMSVKATAVCLEYPTFFHTILPTDLTKVLDIELSETWAILYELASLFDASEESIRPFHASFGDFLFDSLRSLDFFCNRGDIVADITYSMLRRGRDPEVLSYRVFSRLLGDATPRKDLRDALSQMNPISIFKRPTSTYDQRSKGAYYLIPLLRQLENHVSSGTYKKLVTYFDEHFASFLPSGCWSSTIFKDGIKSEGNKANGNKSWLRRMPVSVNAIMMVGSASDSSDSEGYSEEGAAGPGIYRVSELMPLSTSPAWDEINASLNIPLTGRNSLKGFCNEAHFARSHLTKTSSALVNDITQENAALFCLKQIQTEGITEDLQIAFAKLLPHSLLHAKKSLTLTAAIQSLQTRHLTLYQRLPLETQKAITDYLDPRSQKPTKRFPRTVTKSSTQATSSLKPSTTPNSSTARQTAQKSSPVPQLSPSAGSTYTTPSQTQPVPRTSQLPSRSTQTQSFPGASLKASTASRTSQKTRNTPQHPPSADLKSSTPSQPKPAPPIQFSSHTKPSLSIAGKILTLLRTPKRSQPATPYPESSAAQGPSTTSQGPLGPSHSSESSTSAQGPSDSSKHRQGPSTPSQPKPAPPIQFSSQTKPSLSIAGKILTLLRTPKRSQPATPYPESSAAQGPSTTSQSPLGPSHSSESSTSAQGPSDSSEHRQGPSRHRKGG